MPKQKSRPRTKPFGKMSSLERAGLLFGVVGLFADGAALFAFATGVSSLHEYIPKSVPTPSAELFFALLSGLFLIYGWFVLSWYLVRRTFVLLGQMPVRFNYPLVNRSLRTVLGIGIFLIPLAIAWSVVNLPANYVKDVGLTPIGREVTVTPPPSITQTSIAMTPSSGPVLQRRVYLPATDEERIASGWRQYFMFCFPFYLVLFGFIVWLPINLLMPIVHVELLLQEASPDIMDELKEYFEQ